MYISILFKQVARTKISLAMAPKVVAAWSVVLNDFYLINNVII